MSAGPSGRAQGTPGPGGGVADFAAVMRRLRVECPWKREQTHRSLQRFLLEETYEVLEAIDEVAQGADDALLRDELGDLLLQVVFHAAIAEEEGRFDLDDVAEAITAKMVRRNPHVFGPQARAAGDLDADAVEELWQRAKTAERTADPAAETSPGEERGGASGSAPLPPGLPALLYADKTLERRARAGQTELPRADAEDLGDRLLALVAEARDTGVDPEQALRDAVRRLG